MNPMPTESQSLEYDDIQGNILRPYAMDFARYLFLTFHSASRAKAWLQRLHPQVTTARDWGSTPPPYALNLALSFQGLFALNLPKELLESFPEVFQLGMHSRAAVLGDLGENGHEHWDAPLREPSRLHALLMIHARTQEALDTGQRAALTGASPDVSVLHRQDAAALKQGRKWLEHFGFADGIGQPAIEGNAQVPARPGHGTWNERTRRWEPLPAGAFLLGHPDAFQQVAIRPAEPLRLNGTYLVVRKLEQDVAGFRQYLHAQARHLGWPEEQLAARFMGRWRSGAPLALSPEHDDPALAEDPQRNNDFLYEDDPLGHKCPVGAHLRRANPRDSRLSRYVFAHRMLRRGMPYGPPLPEGAPDDGQPRGLMFLAYNASIGEQFELVQQQWLNNGNLTGGLSSTRDPISRGEPCPRPTHCPASDFTVPEADGKPPLASRTLFELPRFVTVRGGEYFFVPGLRALAELARTPCPSSLQPGRWGFLQEYRRLGALENPSERLRKQSQLLMERIFLTPGWKQERALWDELREQAPILPTPLGVLVSRFQDTCEVLGRNEVFSVREYDHRMQLTTGPFFLGFDDTDRYQREASLGRMVVRRGDLMHVRQLAEDITHLFIQQVRQGGQRLDVASLAALALVRVIGNYFGVAGPNDKSMLEWFPAMSAYIFPPFFTDKTRDVATRIGPEVQRYLDGVIAARRRQLASHPGTVFPDDVLQRLLELRDEHGAPLDDILVRRQLAGMVSGSLVATAGVLTGAYRFFVSPELPRELHQQLLDAVEMNDDKLIAGFILEFARKEPTPSMLYRTSVQDYTLARGTARETFIPQGTRVVCGLASAMSDADVISEPGRFWPGRPDWVYLNFGFGQHACLGRHLSMAVMTAILKQLLRLKNPRIVHDERGFPLLPDLEAVPGTPSPERLIIEYEGWDRARGRASV